jgi:hypothetical protein
MLRCARRGQTRCRQLRRSSARLAQARRDDARRQEHRRRARSSLVAPVGNCSLPLMERAGAPSRPLLGRGPASSPWNDENGVVQEPSGPEHAGSQLSAGSSRSPLRGLRRLLSRAAEGVPRSGRTGSACQREMHAELSSCREPQLPSVSGVAGDAELRHDEQCRYASRILG